VAAPRSARINAALDQQVHHGTARSKDFLDTMSPHLPIVLVCLGRRRVLVRGLRIGRIDLAEPDDHAAFWVAERPSPTSVVRADFGIFGGLLSPTARRSSTHLIEYVSMHPNKFGEAPPVRSLTPR
jgi:hypothetical protein